VERSGAFPVDESIEPFMDHNIPLPIKLCPITTVPPVLIESSIPKAQKLCKEIHPRMKDHEKTDHEAHKGREHHLENAQHEVSCGFDHFWHVWGAISKEKHPEVTDTTKKFTDGLEDDHPSYFGITRIRGLVQ